MSRAYYNEIDPYCVQWLRNLIIAGEIAPGDVDDRSITDVQADDVAGYTQCHFFAGIGGWSLGARIAGWPDDRELWTGSCPCQPFSVAGKKAGTDDARHLWPDYFRLIRARRPAVAMGEQVAGAVGKGWLDQVWTDMETIDYAFRPVILPAVAVGAWHDRPRLWFIADAQRNEQPRKESCKRTSGRMGRQQQSVAWNGDWQDSLRTFRAVDDGVQRCVEATDAARNAIVPQVAAEVIAAWMECAP